MKERNSAPLGWRDVGKLDGSDSEVTRMPEISGVEGGGLPVKVPHRHGANPSPRPLPPATPRAPSAHQQRPASARGAPAESSSAAAGMSGGARKLLRASERGDEDGPAAVRGRALDRHIRPARPARRAARLAGGRVQPGRGHAQPVRRGNARRRRDAGDSEHGAVAPAAGRCACRGGDEDRVVQQQRVAGGCLLREPPCRTRRHAPIGPCVIVSSSTRPYRSEAAAAAPLSLAGPLSRQARSLNLLRDGGGSTLRDKVLRGPSSGEGQRRLGDGGGGRRVREADGGRRHRPALAADIKHKVRVGSRYGLHPAIRGLRQCEWLRPASPGA